MYLGGPWRLCWPTTPNHPFIMTRLSRLCLACIVATFGAAALPAAAGPVALPTVGSTCSGVCGSSAADGDIGLSPLGQARYGYVATAGSTALGVSPLTLDDNSRGGQTNGSTWTSGLFNATAGDQIDVWFNYASTDGKGFDDYAWARLLDAGSGGLVAWLFTARSSNSSTGNIVPGDVVTKKEFDPRDSILNYDSYEFTSKTVDDPIDWQPLGDSNGTCWRDNASGCGFTGWLQSRHVFASAGSFRLEVGVINWGDEAYDSGLAFDVAGLAMAQTVPEPGTLPLWAVAAGMAALVRRKAVRPRA